jgi:hypothetical protein
VAGFYSATRDRVMPPLRGLLLLRRLHHSLDDQNAGEHRYIGIMWADLVGGLKRRRKEFSASNVSSLSVIKSPIPLFTVNTCALIAYCEQ